MVVDEQTGAVAKGGVCGVDPSETFIFDETSSGLSGVQTTDIFMAAALDAIPSTDIPGIVPIVIKSLSHSFTNPPITLPTYETESDKRKKSVIRVGDEDFQVLFLQKYEIVDGIEHYTYLAQRGCNNTPMDAHAIDDPVYIYTDMSNYSGMQFYADIIPSAIADYANYSINGALS